MEERKEKFIQQTSESFLNIAAFVVFSFVPYSLLYISMTAAEDILAGTEVPTSVVYLCDIAPYFLGTLVLPVFEDKIPHLLTMLLTFGFDLCGIIFLVAFEHKEAKLSGICLISLGSAFADVGFLSLTALYGEVTVRGYVTGTGIGFAAAVMYYAGATTWFCMSMNKTLMIIMWLPILLPIFYSLMNKKHGNERLVSKTTDHEDIPYSPLNQDSPENQEDQGQLTYREKFEVTRKDMSLFLSFFVGEFGKFFLLQAVVTTLAFPNAPFQPRDHYQYYVFAVMVGDVFGTSYGLVWHCLKCSLPAYTRHTWFFASVIMACVFFLVFASWFRFLHNVWIVIFVAFFVGLSHGVLFNCTFAGAASDSSSARHKGFSRAFLTAGVGAGLLSAALLGLYIEPLLKKHCFHIFEHRANCLTRLMYKGARKCL